LSSIQPHELPDVVDVYETAAEAERGAGNPLRCAVLYDAMFGILVGKSRRDLAIQLRQTQKQRASAFELRSFEGQKEIAQQAQSDREALLLSGRRQRREGRFSAALDVWYDALQADPDNLTIFLEIADSYRIAQNPLVAKTLARSVLDLATLRNEPDVRRDAQRQLARLGGDQVFQQLAIDRYQETGDKVGATSDLMELATNAIERGAYPAAQEALERLIAIDPSRDDAELLLAQVHRQQGDHARAAGVLIDLARKQGKHGDHMKAFVTWREVIALQPDAAAPRKEFGDALIQRGQLAEGASQLAWAASLLVHTNQKEAVAIYLRLAHLYDGLDDIPSALRMFDRLLRSAPGMSDAQEQFVGFCLRRGRQDLAARTLRSLATYMLATRQYKDAVATLTQLSVLQPDDPWSYDELSRILQQQGNVRDAMMLYRRLAERRPGDPGVQKRMNELYALATGGKVPPEGA
jgi:tetratricopeptide (TPR) repeat protein